MVSLRGHFIRCKDTVLELLRKASTGPWGKTDLMIWAKVCSPAAPSLTATSLTFPRARTGIWAAMVKETKTLTVKATRNRLRVVILFFCCVPGARGGLVEFSRALFSSTVLKSPASRELSLVGV